MGREIRRVPPDWQHPRNENGHYRPLLGASYEADLADWLRGKAEWDAPGNAERARAEAEYGPRTWEAWNGEAPHPEVYGPDFLEESATAFQVYENVSEGTPISPVFPTREGLIDWLVNDGTGMGLGGVALKLSRPAAERFVEAGYAPSAIGIEGQGLFSGVTVHERAPAPRGERNEPHTATRAVEDIEIHVSDLWELAGQMEQDGFPDADFVMDLATSLHDGIEALRRFADVEERASSSSRGGDET